MVFFQTSSSALILLPDFTISKFESELCVSSTLVPPELVIYQLALTSCCLGRVLSVPARVCPIWCAHRTHSWVVSSGEVICFLGAWILAQTFYCFVYPASCTGAVLEIMRSHIMLLQPKQAYLLQCVFSYSFVLDYCDFL